MDILLIQPPIRDFYLTAKRTIPYGLACIAARLKAAGFSVDLLDALAASKSKAIPLPTDMAYLEEFYGNPDLSPFSLFHGFRHYGYSYQHLEKKIRESNAFLVGISSLFTPYAEEALETATIVRRALPGSVIVLGGHHPTALPGEVMKHGVVDYLIRGEGEEAFPLLAEALKEGKSVADVPGIVYRNSDGTLHISSPAVMKDLNTPLPDRSLIRNDFYTRAGRPSTVVVTSRGCPLRCSYCCLGNHDLYPYRARSTASVLAEITDAVENHGARFIDFEDENLTFDKPWFLSLLKEITTRFGRLSLELRAMNGLFPPTLDEEVVAAMKDAGFKALNLSLGSICPQQLARFRRPDVRKSFNSALLLAEGFNLDAVGYIIAGAPGQSAETSLEDLLYLAANRVLAGLSVFYPAPGSADYELCRSLRLLPEGLSLLRGSALPLSHTTSRLESVTLMRLARILNFMKSLVDEGRFLPGPAKMEAKVLDPAMDRVQIGERFLAGFLFDGKIRGFTPDGAIYEHATDPGLTDTFRRRILSLPFAGTRRHLVSTSF